MLKLNDVGFSFLHNARVTLGSRPPDTTGGSSSDTTMVRFHMTLPCKCAKAPLQ
jgi:hypothetical protein